MAHFAELDENNVVLRVCVVNNNIETSDGPLGENDKHIDGEKWCEDFWGGKWKQTSYNNNFRKRYAGIGMIYDETKDKFLEPQPFSSWSLDGNDDWKAPVTHPTVLEYDWDASNKAPYHCYWDESNLRWKAATYPAPDQIKTTWNWNPSTKAWEADGVTWKENSETGSWDKV